MEAMKRAGDGLHLNTKNPFSDHVSNLRTISHRTFE